MNTVQLVGRLTKDVELKYTNSGTAVGSFTLAVNRSFTNQQGEREADFILCQVWQKAAENLAKFTRKGSQIGIEGRIQTRNYENQQGTRVYVTEVIVNNFHLLDPKPKDGGQNNFAGPQSHNQQPNYNQQSGYQQQNYNQNQFVSDGRPVNVTEDNLPF